MAEPASELIRLSEEFTGTEWIVKARLRSSRSDGQVLLIISKEVSLKAISIEGKPIPLRPDEKKYWFFKSLAIPREGYNVEMHLEGSDSAKVMIVDLLYGLPIGG